jgi:hypothetical protein
MVVNEWCGRISTEVDKNCPRRGSRAMESVERMFFTCPLAQQAWRCAPNIIWQPFAKKLKEEEEEEEEEDNLGI